MNKITRPIATVTAAIALGLTPIIAGANTTTGLDTDAVQFQAFSNLSSSDKLAINELDDLQLDAVEGTRHRFNHRKHRRHGGKHGHKHGGKHGGRHGGGYNNNINLSLIVAPQINICVYCINVTQVNQQQIFTVFRAP